MNEKPLSLWHCLWGGLFLVAGLTMFVFILVHNINHMVDSLTQVVVPGKAVFNLEHGKRYTVFLEDQSEVNGKIYSSSQPITGLTCQVTSLNDGTKVLIETTKGNTTYNLNSRSGRSVLEFPIEKDGRYELACQYDETSHGPEVVLAVGTGVTESIFLDVGECLAAMFGGIAGCMLVIVLVLLKRSRDLKRIRAQNYPAQTPPPLIR